MYDLIKLPWCVKLELTHGCNLKCKFCPVFKHKELQKKKNWSFAEPETVERFCRQYKLMMEKLGVTSYPRIELSLRGEPLLNPNVLECLQAIRKQLPGSQVTMFSNGLKLLPKKSLLGNLFTAGLNILYLDCYQNTYERFEEHCQQCAPKDASIVGAAEFKPYRKHPNGHKLKVIALVVGLENQKESLNIRGVHNVAGNSDRAEVQKLGWKEKELPLKKNCARLHRELIMHYDGSIVLCCVDWFPTKVTTLGNIFNTTIERLWFGHKHLKALQRLWRKDRTWGLCRTCDFFGGYRQGFLQNPLTEEEEDD